MKKLSCICDEMLKITQIGDSLHHKEMALSWDCSKHGKVAVDFRTVRHVHEPPASPSSFIVQHHKPKLPDRRIRA